MDPVRTHRRSVIETSMKTIVFAFITWFAVGVSQPLVFGQAVDEHPVAASIRDLLGIRALRREYVYLEHKSGPLRLDIHYPRMAAPEEGYPVVFWLHGGAWLMGDRKHDLLVEPLLAHGYAIVSVEYRLASEAKFPAQIFDARSALRWVRQHSKLLSLDIGRMIVSGASAGGHLALLLAYTQGEARKGWGPAPPAGTFRAVVAFYPPTDLPALVGPAQAANPLHPVAVLLGGPLREKPREAGMASPFQQIDRQSPPTLLMHGEQDAVVPASQSKRLAAELASREVPVRLVLSPNGHAFTLNEFKVEKVREFLMAQPALEETWRPRPWWQRGPDPPLEPPMTGRPGVAFSSDQTEQ